MKPKVSIIVPVYNTARYLRKCLDSILAQTLQEIEVIVVNDASPDDSQEIIDEYAQKDTRIVSIIHEHNRGQSGARNTGIEHAKAEILGFIDSDDWAEPSMYKTLFFLMQKYQVDMVHCGIKIEYDIRPSPELVQSDRGYYRLKRKKLYVVDGEDLGSEYCDVSVWNKVFRREHIQKYQLRFPEGLVFEDAYFAWCYFSISTKIYYCHKTLYHYRRRAASIMTSLFEGEVSFAIDHLKICQKFYYFLQKHGLYQRYKRCFWKTYYDYINSAVLYSKESIQLEIYNTIQDFVRDAQIPIEIEPSLFQFFSILTQIDYPVYQVLKDYLDTITSLKADRWYRLGQLSPQQRIGAIARFLSRKLRLY